METTPFSALKALCGFILRTSKRAALPVAAASALVISPLAAHAGPSGTKHRPAASARGKTPANVSANASIRKASFHREPGHPVPAAHALATTPPAARHSNARHDKPTGTVRRAAFTPRHALTARPFDSEDESLPFGLHSNIVYMIDQSTGEALFDKNSQTVTPIASITKLMTAMVVLDSKAPLDELLEVTDDDRDQEKFTSSRLSIGSTLTRNDMLHIALMASENRAAAALSRYYPGGREAFIDAMNRKARELGMVDTHFENPAGLSKYNVSTARDLAKMVNAAYQYPLIRQYSTDVDYEVDTGQGVLYYRSTNALVRDGDWDIGVQKTGYIKESGICLVMQTTIDNRPVVMVLLDSGRRHADFFDAARLRTMLTSGTLPVATQADASASGG
ncbi:serine hydrolase [Burkholderia singularis]|uniref:Murein-DD-endopeptidase n=1 Tax=Burkholderia singularis TaxID=1503053 RepID=A0A238H842_9BURK|nr:serine hydrolase [Burkholderia singularis]SMG01621.1 Murein-DD-endopeptidase [Burkholderia singularis]